MIRKIGPLADKLADEVDVRELAEALSMGVYTSTALDDDREEEKEKTAYLKHDARNRTAR